MKIMYNIKMRLTPITIFSAIAAVLLVGLLLLLESYPTSAFKLSEEGELQHHHISPGVITSKYDNRNNEISSSDNSPGSSSIVLPKSSLSLSSASSASSKSGDSGSSSNVISKRSLSSSSSSSSSDPSSFRSHRHENSILNVAWPGKAIWGFLPSKKKPGGVVGVGAPPPQQAPPPPLSSLHSQSATSSYSKKASSSSSLAQAKSQHQSEENEVKPGKKKSASSDLFLDPVTLDEMPSHYFRRGEGSTSSGGSSGAPSSSNSFFHNSASSLSSSNLGSSKRQAGDESSPTPPPRPHYILLQPPTRIEPPLGNDESENDVFAGEDLDATREFASIEREEDAEHASWLKRSPSSGVINRESLDINKRTRNYDVPQIECPPAEDGMERFACPSTDRFGRYRCVDDHVLCDGFIDCPGKEDEDLQACMFYKTTKAHLDVLADALLRWARGKR